jgi:TetR/AcrR family transcriptional regulator, copper-responsive repressor
MVQKHSKAVGARGASPDGSRGQTDAPPRRPRGRPRAYDAEQALTQARDAFWDTGYTGTSLDELTEATGMNRPSLYGAFGDKHALYLQTLERYRESGRTAMREELSYERPLAEALRSVFARAISIYMAGKRGARGCYLIGTAATEAVHDARIRAVFAAGLHELDDLMEARLRHAIAHGELRTDIEPAALARILCGIMNSFALRARAGESRELLEATAEAAVRLVTQR